jgi:3-hydroxyisobutyrate dehydrogenase
MGNADGNGQLRVGFVGLGDIGGPMAGRVMAAGFPTTLWARRERSLAPFEGMPYERAETLADLGRASDVVGVCVFGENDVSEVVLGENGILEGMARGGTILIHSTVSADYAVDLSRTCGPWGVTVLDAPVSGFRRRALTGELTVMVGGPPEAYERVRPVLETFGEHVELLGGVGQGLAMKALNQALAFANIASAALALTAGRQLGLDRAATERVLSSASGSSKGMEVLVDRILKDEVYAELVTNIAAKDLAAFDKLCQAAGIPNEELRDLAAGTWERVARLQKA